MTGESGLTDLPEEDEDDTLVPYPGGRETVHHEPHPHGVIACDCGSEHQLVVPGPVVDYVGKRVGTLVFLGAIWCHHQPQDFQRRYVYINAEGTP